MATAVNSIAGIRTGQDLGRTLNVYLKEIKYEFLKNLRLTRYSVSTIAFPVMFYILFGLVLGKQEVSGVNMSKYLIATYGTFGVIAASLFGTASSLAAERGLGWVEVKKASPMPPFAYFLAKAIMSMIFSGAVVLVLMALGFLFGGVQMSVKDSLEILGILVAGSLPFCAMGLALGYFVGPNSAPATINLIYLPMSVCSGLWFPIIFLPKLMRQIAEALPSYHLAQLALSVFSAGQHEAASLHWELLAGFTLICLGVARLGYQRDEQKMYG
jgi:ABC-2 type transport system permease protein